MGGHLKLPSGRTREAEPINMLSTPVCLQNAGVRPGAGSFQNLPESLPHYEKRLLLGRDASVPRERN